MVKQIVVFNGDPQILVVRTCVRSLFFSLDNIAFISHPCSGPIHRDAAAPRRLPVALHSSFAAPAVRPCVARPVRLVAGAVDRPRSCGSRSAAADPATLNSEGGG